MLVHSLLVRGRSNQGADWAAADVEDETDEWHGTFLVRDLEPLAFEFTVCSSFVLDEGLVVVVFGVEHILNKILMFILQTSRHINTNLRLIDCDDLIRQPQIN